MSTTTIDELKKNPLEIIEKAQDKLIEILNKTKPVAYLILPEAFENFLDVQDALAYYEALEDKEAAVEVNLNDL